MDIYMKPRSKVSRSHPQRRYRVAYSYFVHKKTLDQFDDEGVAAIVACKFGVNAATLLRDFSRNMVS